MGSPATARVRRLPDGAAAAPAREVPATAGDPTDPLAEAGEKVRRLAAEVLPPGEAGPVADHLGVVLGIGTEQATDRQVLFFSARRLIEALANERPTAFGFEDIHWAEPSMLDLLEFLAGRVRDAPALFVASARPELFDTRPGWGGGLSTYTALGLDPLSDDDVHRLALGLLDDPSPSVVERLRDAAGGNPLFVEELAASLAEGTTDPGGALPTSVKLIIAARIPDVQFGHGTTLSG